MNKKLLCGAAFYFALMILSAQEVRSDKPIYISPNNDGVQDELVIPLSISDKRYIREWSFVVTDENGTVVRTIGNKESRPERLTFKSFFKQLFTPKLGVQVPPQIIWNGTADSGSDVPDGMYKYYITATDDNGNMNKTESYQVVVDNTPPEVSIEPASGTSLIFSPDGDGNKDTFIINQKGSEEDLWSAVFSDASGKNVRTLAWRSGSPEQVIWDGKNDDGTVCADGVYSYRIVATDRAGNTTSATINNIILDTIRPVITLTIDINYFSPNADKIRDEVRITPGVPVTQGLSEWKLEIQNTDRKTVRSYDGTGKPPASIIFDGKNSTGTVLPEGDYYADFSVTYVNGYRPHTVSPIFSLDITPPKAQVRLSGAIVSPNGDGQLDTITIYQEASAEISWQGLILDKDGKAVRTWNFVNTAPTSIVWNGMTDTNTLAPDGFYRYKLSSIDRAGNSGEAQTDLFELNTGTTEVILTMSKEAFSPVVSGQGTITFSPVVKTSSKITDYSFTILDNAGTVVKTMKGSALPRTFEWNGIDDGGVRVPDGTYSAKLETLSQNGSRTASATGSFIMDSVSPSVEITSPYLVFSPNGDGKKDSLPITIKTSGEELWTAVITNSDGKAVSTKTWTGEAQSFDWDGTDENGNPVPDGTYTLRINSSDKAGNSAEAVLGGIVVDNRSPKAFITASESAFSPNGNGVHDIQQFSLMTSIPDGIATWEVVIKQNDRIIRRWNQNDSVTIPAVINWDGKNAEGTITEGTMSATFTLEYVKGDQLTMTTPPFLCWVTPPALTVKTAPQYFSPDNDGVDDDLFISLKVVSPATFESWSFEINDPQNGSSFWKTAGTNSITERIIWDGRSSKGELVQSATDYPYTFTVKDNLGMTSTVKGLISVDVLVIKVGDVLKMQVPSIIFRENAADFNSLPKDTVDKNNFVLKRVAEILNKFRDYKVTIEGHANNVTGTEREETEELVPLSQARAAAIKDTLVKLGVDGNRLSTLGVGGRQPVVARNDHANWWKNRRVEFILNK